MSPGGPGGEGSTLQAPSGGSLDERDVAVTCYSVWFGFVGRTLIRVNRKYGRKKGSVRIKISSILEDADHVDASGDEFQILLGYMLSQAKKERNEAAKHCGKLCI